MTSKPMKKKVHKKLDQIWETEKERREFLKREIKLLEKKERKTEWETNVLECLREELGI